MYFVRQKMGESQSEQGKAAKNDVKGNTANDSQYMGKTRQEAFGR